MEVGQRIRDRRQAAGLTQVELAQAANVSQPGLLAIERGVVNPQLATLSQLATALQTSVRDLVCGRVQLAAPESPDSLASRVRRVAESGDPQAQAIVESALVAAEALLERRPPMRRRVGTMTERLRRILDEQGKQQAEDALSLVRRMVRQGKKTEMEEPKSSTSSRQSLTGGASERR